MNFECRANRSALTLTELLVVIAVIVILISLMLPAVQFSRESVRKVVCSDKIRQLSLSLHNFEATYKRLPPGHEGMLDKRPFQSWIPKLLPYLEGDQVFEEIENAYQSNFNPFNTSVHRHFTTVLPALVCPSDPRVAEKQNARGTEVALSSFVGINGTNYRQKDGMLFFQSRVGFKDVSDGLSNTLAIVERPPSADFYFGWWYAGFGSNAIGAWDSVVGTSELNPLDYSHVGAFCTKGPYIMQRRALQDAQCGTFHPWSLHTVVNVARADGSSIGLSYDISPTVLIALGTRAAGEVAHLDDNQN